MTALPAEPPFALRARLLSPLADGGLLDEPDGLIEVDAAGRITRAARWPSGAEAPASVLDLRPLVVMPGMVDLHAHLPQLPNAGLGSGLDLLTWLDRYIFPLERAYDRSVAERQAPAAFRAFAAAGTTTVVAYAALWPDSTDAAFAAAEAHGIRAVIGKVMMDRLSYDTEIDPGEILETSLRQSDELATRWHGRDGGRLRYAFTPRFAVSCSAEMLRESAALATQHGAYWQTHLSEDAGEIAEVARLFPEARDYLDVYDRAGALGARTILAHAIHLSPREVARLVESGLARRALPGLEPLPVERDDAARRRTASAGMTRRPRQRRGRRPGGLDVQRHARRRGHPARPGAHRPRRVVRTACVRSTGCGWARWTGRGCSGMDGRDRLAGGGEGSRPHRHRPALHEAAARRRPAGMPPMTSPAASSSGRTRTWSAAPGCGGACSPDRRAWTASARLGA